MKRNVNLAILAALGFSLSGGVVANAANYLSATEAKSDVGVTIELGENGGPDIPGIDPEDPNPPVIDPEDQNPNRGEFSIVYVSDIAFPTVSVSTSERTIHAEKPMDSADPAKEFMNMITLQDFRPDGKRSGWELTVKMDQELISGSILKLNPFVDKANEDKGIEAGTTELAVNLASQVFASGKALEGNTENETGIYSLGMADPDGEGISLSIPANTPVGDYSTTLTWELVSGV